MNWFCKLEVRRHMCQFGAVWPQRKIANGFQNDLVLVGEKSSEEFRAGFKPGSTFPGT